MSGRYLTDMADVLRAVGVTVVEQDGWRTRARSSGGYATGRPWCVMWHHTASSANATAANDAAYMSFSADAKPIANLLVARDASVWVLAAGATNTNGKGNPLGFSRGVVPADSMNLYAIGVELQNTGVGQTYPTEQIDAAFAASLALCAAYGLAPTDVATHALYAPGRKIDPATAAAVTGPWRPRAVTSAGTWSPDDLRAELARRAALAPDPPEPEAPDMTDEQAAQLAQAVALGQANAASIAELAARLDTVNANVVGGDGQLAARLDTVNGNVVNGDNTILAAIDQLPR